MIGVAVIGGGAFGQKHLDGLKQIDGVEAKVVMGRREEQIRGIAEQYGVAKYTTDFDDAINTPGVDAVIITSPTQLHAQQAIAAMRAGKHVEIEIPMADSVADAEAICAVQKETGVIAMAEIGRAHV